MRHPKRSCAECSVTLSSYNPNRMCWPCYAKLDAAGILPNRTHGNASTYRAGCACDPCRTAHRDHYRALRGGYTDDRCSHRTTYKRAGITNERPCRRLAQTEGLCTHHWLKKRGAA